MAPRGRPKKVGLTRMDAALDALCQLGFSRVLIRKTVKSLLKVYGDSGWVFIEDDSYKVVIEKILENEEECLQEKEADAIPTTSMQTELEMEQSNPETREEMETGDPHTAAETERDLPLAGGESEGTADSEKIKALPPAGDTARTIFEKIEALPPAGGLLCKTRKNPCYGWISSIDEEEDKIIIFRTNDSFRRVPIGREHPKGEKRRKTRWDMKPEDL